MKVSVLWVCSLVDITTILVESAVRVFRVEESAKRKNVVQR
jgi:hypothetical protein